MANYRKKQKVAGRLTVTQGPGGTTTSHGSSTMKDGRGVRRTTTTKRGKTYTRITEGAGNGWFKTTQRSSSQRRSAALNHNTKDPFKLTQRDYDKILNDKSSSGDSTGAGFGILVIIGIVVLVWLVGIVGDVYNWIEYKLTSLFGSISADVTLMGEQASSGIEKHGMFEFILSIILCCLFVYYFFKFIIKMVSKL